MNLKETMRNAGIVGAGGAGFPSYAKLAEGIDTLLINGAECEPLLYTDYTILKEELLTVLTGATSVLNALSANTCCLCIKEHTAELLGFSDGERLADGICIKLLPNVYPIGDEIALIYEATGRLVQPGALPSSERVVVYNVETLYNVGCAVKSDTPLTLKWVTVGGDVAKPVVLKVPIGTPVSDLLSSLGIKTDGVHEVLDGGPSMGRPINPSTASVRKNTKAILVLPKRIQAAAAKHLDARMATVRAETACCQCTRCTDLCPRALLGYPLNPHKMVRASMAVGELMPETVIAATLCSSCGICETLACPQGISPRAVIAGYKTLLSKKKMRFLAKQKYEVTPEREYRKLPSQKWKRLLGVEEFDRIPEYIGERVDFPRLIIHTNQSIGIPSVPVVNAGERVEAGQLIATAASGLSLPIHSPISGIIEEASAERLIIKQNTTEELR